MNLCTDHCQLIEKHKGGDTSHLQASSSSKREKNEKIVDFEWEVRLTKNQQTIGGVQLKSLPDTVSVELGYDNLEVLRQLNVIEEILRKLVDFSFLTLKVPRLMMMVRSIDFELTKVVKKLGMRLDEKVSIGGAVFSKYSLTHPINEKGPLLKMRSSAQIQREVLEFVKREAEIRILIQTGLRLNRDAPLDIMRDYRFCLGVKSEKLHRYTEDCSWMETFGELLVVKKNKLTPSHLLFQMQFQDGIRLDFEFLTLDRLKEYVISETLYRVILDKDHQLPLNTQTHLFPSRVSCPTEEEFQELLNDIWWNQIEVAKALYREEVTLVGSLYEKLLTEGLTTLLGWMVEIKYDWKVDLGRKNRWLKRYLSDTSYQEYLSLYPNQSYGGMWERLFLMKLFVEKYAKKVAGVLGYTYDVEQGEKVAKFLHRINSLPSNASEFH